MKNKMASILMVTLGIALSSNADIIGPGAYINANGTDDVDTLNIMQIATSLSAGSYTVDQFSFNSRGASGTITPFLVTGTPSVYSVIWVGPTYTATTEGGILTAAYENEIFTIDTVQNVYAGYYVSGVRVGFNDVGDYSPWSGYPDDLATTFTAPSVGSTIDTFLLTGFERTYAYEIGVSIPEPTTIGLLVGGGFACLTRRKKSR